jgi:hypothetical protein
MKVTLKSNFGTLAHMVEFISNATIEIGSENSGNFKGHFYAGVKIQSTFGYADIIEMRTYSSGHKHTNNGISRRMELPFKPTILAQEAFNAFSREVEKILVEFVETETLSK